MFTIDLLKGEGIPVKSKPESIAIGAITVAVPVMVAIAMAGYYLHTKIIISIHKRKIINYEKKISEFTDAMKMRQSLEKERQIINNTLAEVEFSLARHMQWSPILVTLAKNLPTSVVLTELSLIQRAIKKKIRARDNPKQMIEIAVPVRTLQIHVDGLSYPECELSLREFREKLMNSDLKKPKLSPMTKLLQDRHILLSKMFPLQLQFLSDCSPIVKVKDQVS